MYWSTLDARKRCVYTCRILVCHPPVADSDLKNMMAPEENRTIAHSPPSLTGNIVQKCVCYSEKHIQSYNVLMRFSFFFTSRLSWSIWITKALWHTFPCQHPQAQSLHQEPTSQLPPLSTVNRSSSHAISRYKCAAFFSLKTLISNWLFGLISLNLTVLLFYFRRFFTAPKSRDCDSGRLPGESRYAEYWFTSSQLAFPLPSAPAP